MNLPALVSMALARIQSGEAFLGAVAWTWDRADTDSRLAVDEWLISTKHPLGRIPSTREQRFRILVEEKANEALS